MDVTLPNGTVVKGVPDGMSKDELVAKLAANGHDVSWHKPEAAPNPTKPAPVEPQSMTDKAALIADKILTDMGNALPDWVPSRQDIVNFAGGASTLGGALANAPRLKNTVDQESGAYTLGRIADPAMMIGGGKLFQAIQNAPKLANAGRFVKNLVGGAGTGAGTSLPLAVREVAEGNPEQAIADVAKGAAIGGVVAPALAPVGWAADKVMGFARNFAGGTEGRVSDWLRNELSDHPAVKQAIQSLRGFLPGEKVTVGQAANAAQEAKLGAMERGARSRPYAASEFAKLDEANRNARLAALQDNAAIMEPAAQFRGDVTKPLYALADAQQVPMTDTLRQIFGGDMVAALRNRASRTGGQMETNAQVAGRDFNPRQTPGRPAPTSDFAFEGQMENVGPTPGTVSVNELQLLKSAMDDEINAFSKGLPSPTGLTGVNIKQLKEARSQLIDETNRLSPEWKEARTTFADKSRPVNQGAVMTYLANALRRPAAGEGAAAFNTAMKDLPRTFERATGMPRFSSGEEALASLSPLGQRTVKNVQASLEREADVAKNWTAPQSSLRNIENPVDVIEGATPGMLSKTVSIIRKGAQKVGAGLDAKAQEMLDRAMLNPSRFVELMDQIPASDRLPVLTKMYERATGPEIKGMIQAQISNFRGASDAP